MAKCDKVNLLKLQGQFMEFIVENHAELNILEHIEQCTDCRKKIQEAVLKEQQLPDYGNLFQREFDDPTVPQYSDYKNPVNFINARIQWRKRKLKELIKNAEMELLVSDTDAALDSITLIASDYGGYIISSHSWYEDDFKYATVRLGVPVEEFENILRRLRGLALRVINEIASGEDVTDQFVDLQSRLTNLQATRDRIREFLDKAETVEEALQVNEQLSEVEGQIEEIQGRMNYLKDRAAYSTIDVQLNTRMATLVMALQEVGYLGNLIWTEYACVRCRYLEVRHYGESLFS